MNRDDFKKLLQHPIVLGIAIIATLIIGNLLVIGILGILFGNLS